VNAAVTKADLVQENLPELPENDDNTTEDEYGQEELFDFEDDLDEAQQPRNDKHESSSQRGADTPSGTSAKRSYDQLEDEQASPPSSPDSKRLRAV